MDGWKVLPHGPLEQLADRLWLCTGSLEAMPIPRNMVIYRLDDGRLLIHSAVCVDEARLAEITALGEPTWLLVPNQGHRLDAKAWKARFPHLQVICPRNARAKVEEVLPVEAVCEDELPPLGITCLVPPGFKDAYELIYDVPVHGGRALVVNDVLGNGQKMPGFKGMLFGLLGTPGGGLGRPRIVSLAFGKDRASFKPFVEQLAARDDLVALTVSHGPPITGAQNIRAGLQSAAGKL
jgi:hypothetical protein